MKKIFIPIYTRKEKALKTLIVSAFFLTIFSIHSFGQCCIKFTSTKTCRNKSTGTVTAIPCTPGNYTFTWDDPNAQNGPVATGLAAGVCGPPPPSRWVGPRTPLTGNGGAD